MRCAVAPVPEEENAYLSGLARTSATNSLALLAGNDGPVTSAKGARATRLAGKRTEANIAVSPAVSAAARRFISFHLDVRALDHARVALLLAAHERRQLFGGERRRIEACREKTIPEVPGLQGFFDLGG